MVIKMPHDQTRLISRPSNTNRVAPADSADRMDRICCATTDNTSMLIRLNSSKQPHAPVYKKKETKCGRTRYMVHAHATTEKFQNDVSSLKTHQMFFVPPTRRIWKRTNLQSFWICVWGKLGKDIIWLWWRHRFPEAPFYFPSTLKRKAGVFKFLQFEERFRKAPFSEPISVFYLYITYTTLWFPNS